MLLTGLLPDISTDPAIETAADSVEAGRSGTIVAPAGIRPPLLARLASRAKTPLVVLTATLVLFRRVVASDHATTSLFLNPARDACTAEPGVVNPDE